ncbi:MAG: hypothetical protein WCP03_03845, partial [Candidatus Saccharibacteria bacterium]
FMIKEKMSEFGVYANIIWIDSSLYATYDELIAAAEPKQKRGFPNRVEITIQVDDKGNHYLFDNIRREYIFE